MFLFLSKKTFNYVNKDWTLQYIVFHEKYPIFFGSIWVSFVALFLYFLWSSDMVLGFLSEFIEKAKKSSPIIYTIVFVFQKKRSISSKNYFEPSWNICALRFILSDKHSLRHKGQHTKIITTNRYHYKHQHHHPRHNHDPHNMTTIPPLDSTFFMMFAVDIVSTRYKSTTASTSSSASRAQPRSS